MHHGMQSVFYYSVTKFLINYLVVQAEAQTDEVFAQVTLLPEPEVGFR